MEPVSFGCVVVVKDEWQSGMKISTRMFMMVPATISLNTQMNQAVRTKQITTISAQKATPFFPGTRLEPKF